jgi:hypothetical protein
MEYDVKPEVKKVNNANEHAQLLIGLHAFATRIL